MEKQRPKRDSGCECVWVWETVMEQGGGRTVGWARVGVIKVVRSQQVWNPNQSLELLRKPATPHLLCVAPVRTCLCVCDTQGHLIVKCNFTHLTYCFSQWQSYLNSSVLLKYYWATKAYPMNCSTSLWWIVWLMCSHWVRKKAVEENKRKAGSMCTVQQRCKVRWMLSSAIPANKWIITSSVFVIPVRD